MPLTDSYGQGVSYPTLTDKPNAQTLGQGIVDAVVPKLAMRFASATVRGATISAPKAGMVSWLIAEKRFEVYDGSGWTVVSAGAQPWRTPTLRSGYSADGNDNGVPQYRIINEFGEQTVVWKGGLNVPYTGGAPNSGGNFLSASLPAAARPGSRRTVTAACSAVSSDSLSVKIDFNTDGGVAIVTQTGVQPPWVSLNNIRYSL